MDGDIGLIREIGVWAFLLFNLVVAVVANIRTIAKWLGGRVEKALDEKEEEKDREAARADQVWSNGLKGREQAVRILERVLDAKELEIERERGERRDAVVAAREAQREALRVAQEWRSSYDRLADLMLESVQVNTEHLGRQSEIAKEQIAMLGDLKSVIGELSAMLGERVTDQGEEGKSKGETEAERS